MSLIILRYSLCVLIYRTALIRCFRACRKSGCRSGPLAPLPIMHMYSNKKVSKCIQKNSPRCVQEVSKDRILYIFQLLSVYLTVLKFCSRAFKVAYSSFIICKNREKNKFCTFGTHQDPSNLSWRTCVFLISTVCCSFRWRGLLLPTALRPRLVIHSLSIPLINAAVGKAKKKIEIQS